jgi:hypothetical protein
MVIRDHFRISAKMDRSGLSVQPIQRQLVGPAAALGLAGFLSCLGALLSLAAESPESLFVLPTWLASFLLFGPILGAPLLWGSYTALRMESYWFVKLSCLMALIPCGLGYPIAILAGIWGLNVLARPDVQSAFARRAARYRKELERALDEYDADLREP